MLFRSSSGSVGIYGVSSGGGVAGGDGTGAVGFLGYGNAGFYSTAGGCTTRLGYLSGGNNFSLYGSGQIQANLNNNIGSGTACYFDGSGRLGYSSSSRETKTNIQLLGDVSWIYNLDPVSFNRRKQDESGNYTEEFYPENLTGLIAEDAESVNKDILMYVDADGSSKVVGVHYDRLITPILKALQDLRKEFDEYKSTHP